MTKVSHGKVPGDSADAFKQIYGARAVASPKKGSRKPVAKKKTRKSIAVKR